MSDLSRLLPSDIYLLEKWDSSSGYDPVAQRSRIFRDYVQLGNEGRWPYHEASNMDNHPSLTEDQIQILEASRTPRQRALAWRLIQDKCRPWLRIDYQNVNQINPMDNINSDAFPQSIIQSNEDLSLFILDDQSQYSFDSWDQVLACLPEITNSAYPETSPEWFQEKLDEAKGDLENALRDMGPDYSSEEQNDPEQIQEIRSNIHEFYVSGVLWVHGQDTTETSNMLLIWLDQYGRVVRKVYMDPEDVYNISGCFDMGRDMDSQWWNEALVGEVYENGNWL